ncbi:MAG TPA: RNA methyltransferase [Pseudonocardiaceae bacterium]|nr:RNA methyltransferase [Pseudonocardiaceae bacterium]
MGEIVEVHDVADPRLADFRDLTVADRRPDRPGGRGLVIAEGVIVVRRLLNSPYPPRAVFGVPEKVSQLATDVAAPCYTGSPELMAQVVGFHLNRGVLATADRAPVPRASELIARSHHLAVLEGVNDHENLGGLFRNAAAFGVDAVLLGPRCADPLYRRSVRVSMGHVLRVPFVTLSCWTADRCWTADLDALRDAGFRVAALTPAADAVPLPEAGLGTGRVAWLLGAEGPGLSAEALAAADVAVRIPMAPGVDSLNVATAAAIAFATVRCAYNASG